MANPQRENGHTDIANEIMENFARLHLSGNEWQILVTVLRKTYGWHKKEDEISLSQFQEATTLSRPAVCKALKALVAKCVLVAKQQPGTNIYYFNKDYTKWTSSKIATSSILRTSSKNDNQLVAKTTRGVVAKQQHTKETITKETIQKKISSVIQEFKSLNPHYERFFQNLTQRSAVERMVKLHGEEKVRGAVMAAAALRGIKFSPQITTPLQLEDKWAQLENKWAEKKKGAKVWKA